MMDPICIACDEQVENWVTFLDMHGVRQVVCTYCLEEAEPVEPADMAGAH